MVNTCFNKYKYINILDNPLKDKPVRGSRRNESYFLGTYVQRKYI